MDPDSNIGVYKLKVGDLYYIGSSTNLKGRKRNHLKALREGTHTNHRLQQEYDNNPHVQFTILQHCKWSEVRVIEQTYLDKYFGMQRCANIEQHAVSTKRPTRQLRPPK